MGTLLVAMPGGGISRSEDDGSAWSRPGFGNGMHQNAVVRTLVNDPRDPNVAFCGCDKGIMRSEDRGRNWQLLDNLPKGKQVWRMAVDPVDPDIMFAGTGLDAADNLSLRRSHAQQSGRDVEGLAGCLLQSFP